MTLDEADEVIEEICDNADEIIDRGISDSADEFAEGVKDKAKSIGDTIERTGKVSVNQEQALNNMCAATRNWLD